MRDGATVITGELTKFMAVQNAHIWLYSPENRHSLACEVNVICAMHSCEGDNMLHYQFIAALALTALAPLGAQAQNAPAATPATAAAPVAITAGAFLRTSDGKRAGQIFSIDKAADGSITGAALIGANSTLVHVPIATISTVDKSHFTTSMTYKQIFG
jgi:hypothetical protein